MIRQAKGKTVHLAANGVRGKAKKSSDIVRANTGCGLEGSSTLEIEVPQ